MKVTATDLPPRQVVLEIEVEQDRFDRAMDQAFRRIAGRVRVPGFRPGKAPRQLIERQVGRQAIVEDAVEHLAPDVVNEAIRQENIEPYSRPRVDIQSVEPLTVKATVPLAPTITLGDLASVSIPREDVSVQADQVDAVVDRLRESYAQWVPVERPVQVGDRVTLDLRGTVVDGLTTLMDSKDAEYVVDPRGPQPAVGFAAQMEGMREGEEKSFTLNVPDDYRDRDVAGKPVLFRVTLHGIKEKQLPDLDDAFAQQAGEYTNLAGLREAVEKQLREREEERVRRERETGALDRLVEVSSIEVAPQLVESQTRLMLEEFGQNVERQGLKLEQYLRFVGKQPDDFVAEMRTEAEQRVKRSLALDAFAHAQQIEAQPEEVEAELKAATAALPNPREFEVAARANPETMQRIHGVVRERKALARLAEHALGQADHVAPAEQSPKSAEAGAVPTDTPKKSRKKAAAGVAEEPQS